jgi:hypothetical protein
MPKAKVMAPAFPFLERPVFRCLIVLEAAFHQVTALLVLPPWFAALIVFRTIFQIGVKPPFPHLSSGESSSS